jgi:hypothetical protein
MQNSSLTLHPSKMHRRTFLRSSGITLGLPLLNSMLPTSLRAASQDKEPDIRRMLSICSPLGIHTPLLFPKKAGRNYEITPYLESLQTHREKFTVISGLMHPDVDGGHSAEKSYLTGAAHPGQPSFKNTISVDQYAAERIGHLTRVPSLSLSANNTGLSYSRSGVRIPPETRPSRVFAKLFLEGNAEQKAAHMRQIEDGQSIMDLVGEQTTKVSRKLGREDNQTLDQYLTSVRELEKRLVIQKKWAHLPKPKVDRKPFSDVEDRADFVSNMELMYDLIFLAFRTDSTRLITFCGAGGNYVPTLKGVDEDWHNLSHHGRDENKIEKLAIIELEEMRLFAKFMSRLDEVKEGGHTLLDQTAIFSGSNLGNASSHDNSNLPVIAAGGHFKHGQHLTFDSADKKTSPLANLFVSHLQHLGLETETFASGTSTLNGLNQLS